MNKRYCNKNVKEKKEQDNYSRQERVVGRLANTSRTRLLPLNGAMVLSSNWLIILKERPEAKGFSDKNLWRMKQFYETYNGVDEKLSPW